MLPKGLGILVFLGLATIPALAQVSISPMASKTASVRPAFQHAPMKFHLVRPDGSVESANWSGYAVTGSDFTNATGSWTVSAVNCTKTPDTYSAFWVGIDGYSSDTVEQTGTIGWCNGKKAEYYAWYEFYPAGSVEISSVPVVPGDQISAEISFSDKEFTTTITNVTTGKTYSKTETVSGATRSSAEWIAEAPCCTSKGYFLPLSDFGTGSFGLDYTSVSDTNYATDSGKKGISGAIGAFGTKSQKITMINASSVDEAVPSAISSDGSSFQVVWKSK
ncbi:MAG: G1 family glutamic endopeptidase [Terriglobales bacterium]|jgi:hypothetical protein